jgi:hypothetical protein
MYFWLKYFYVSWRINVYLIKITPALDGRGFCLM